MKTKYLIAGGILFACSLTSAVFAKPLQILHTNDLHGFLENTVYDPEFGGYASINAAIDFYRDQAKQEGIETLLLDAGDFSEGNLFYMANRGRNVFEMMNLMRYDAVVLGNHDWYMGTMELNEAVYDTNRNLLAANLKFFPVFTGLKKYLRPYKVFNFYGNRIGVLGLTTDEMLFSWRVKGAQFRDPLKTAEYYEPRMKSDLKTDYIIALTHIGVEQDVKLAKASKNIDLIVGGHSHTTLETPLIEKNRVGKKVPIVQAGYHGRYLGRMLVDIESKSPMKILKYELIPITADTEHGHIWEYVQESKEELNQIYGEGWLQEKLATAHIPLINSEKVSTVWSDVIVDAIRESVGSEIAVHSPSLAGANLPPGPITREMLFNTYPRVFDLDDLSGWQIWNTRIMGIFLKWAIEIMISTGQAFNMSGVTFHIEDSKIKQLKVNGEDIRLFKLYKVALPEGVVRAAFGITDLVRFVLIGASRSKYSIWGALSEKVTEMVDITDRYQSRPPFDVYRTMVPAAKYRN